VKQLFEQARQLNFQGIEHDCYQTTAKGHGRQENQTYWVMGQTEFLIGSEYWPKLSSIGCVESQRQIGDTSPQNFDIIC
jgi:hypothetical protein